ncbi:hypothetical protein A0H81_13933 [Grifola frondosa]|uniref:Uncharacterized protein n=1 Tax=Grifola frondosa TaxID=5627 RepID=A0A1C7LMV3_GRIFR|nr:hypothetical protein A0H81_13933 [Grifola frondosa]
MVLVMELPDLSNQLLVENEVESRVDPRHSRREQCLEKIGKVKEGRGEAREHDALPGEQTCEPERKGQGAQTSSAPPPQLSMRPTSSPHGRTNQITHSYNFTAPAPAPSHV